MAKWFRVNKKTLQFDLGKCRFSACNSMTQSPAVPERRKATTGFMLDCCTPGRRFFLKGATVKEIGLKNGGVSLVDDADFEAINRFPWRRSDDGKTAYAVRMQTVNGKACCVRMHRQLLDFPSGFVDHANGNGLDNQRKNLRACSNGQNQSNAGKHSDSHQPYKGICFVAKRNSPKKWNACLNYHGKRHALGYYIDAETAAKAYDAAAKIFWGDFAKLNFP